MGFDLVKAGKDVPNDINVIIEIPAHADPIKFEVDKDSGAVFVDRFMGTSMCYPCNYGYVPHTIAGDGDPVDVLVVTPFALLPGVVIRCRPIGMLKMEDDGGQDAKVLAVPADEAVLAVEGIGRGGKSARVELKPAQLETLRHRRARKGAPLPIRLKPLSAG